MKNRDIEAHAPLVLVVKITTFIGRISPFRLLTKILGARERFPFWRRFLTTHPIAGRRLVVDSRVDNAALYVLLWLAVLVVLFMATPAWSGASVAGRIVCVLALLLAVWRYVDVMAYQIGILLDPRQRVLQSAPRSLIVLSLNIVELTLVAAIAMHVLGAETASGQVMDRADSWIRAFNLVAFLEPIERAGFLVLVAQVLNVLAGVLFLIVGFGTVLGLITGEFSRPDSDDSRQDRD
ncbi:hypothetical protein EV193_113124 [Herbihabitans rhizosphaerae]|uniref:Uncharacterized protein n=1 Tax=Herbihabitans rhizosphaerae TaxID=1872711 RepID=A0A4Q7KEC4_9PSEU|nr:hypothetical protein [Herbihabitans rhizosphaerae]RZS32280.1 hypothetical protein EV193_113124 [Herbihabitans rhizosphaerae]